MSLRARLIALLLVLAGAGLVVLGAVTYTTQRSFLLDQVDDQTRAAAGILGGPGRGGGFPGPRPPGRRGGPRPQVDLPPGTYAERRDASGQVVESRVVSVGGASLSPPDLPDALRPGRAMTVGAEDGSGLEYRVRVTAPPFGGGLAVVAVPLTRVQATLARLLLVEALVILGVLGLLALASAALVRIGLRPLERIEATAGAIAGGDLSRRVDVAASQRTEVGRLGLALNAMLGRLERAFAEREASEGRLRRFLSDASHELRTPLASIRGYAELYRIGAARDPRDMERAMRRIEEEAARMGVLVEDLLTLARLDEVRDVATEPVDLGLLAEDAVADARVTDPTRAIETRADGEVVVEGEPDRLRQVLANLLRNALVHTPAGTPLQVRVRRDGPEVELVVRDHGPGLPADADGDALFERFWRAEGAGRGRGRAGAGLGLAIVAGIVAAHHGTVRAADAPGGGAQFVMRLPVDGASPGGR